MASFSRLDDDDETLQEDTAPLLVECGGDGENAQSEGAPTLPAVLDWWDGVGVSVGVVVRKAMEFASTYALPAEYIDR